MRKKVQRLAMEQIAEIRTFKFTLPIYVTYLPVTNK